MNRAAAVVARLLHLLEPERRSPTARIDEVLRGAVAARLIPESRAPERHHLGPIGRARDDKEALDLGRVRGESQLSGGRGDLAGKLDVGLAHSGVVLSDREHAHGHAVVPQVNFGLQLVDAGQSADRLHEPSTSREGPGLEVRIRAVAEDAPVLDALGLAELLWGDVVGHMRLLITRHCCEARTYGMSRV